MNNYGKTHCNKKKQKSECHTEPPFLKGYFQPECQFTIHLDTIVPDTGARIIDFQNNPFIGDNTKELSGMANYQFYRGNISDSQFFAERSEAEGWLQQRYGLTVVGYVPFATYQGTNIYQPTIIDLSSLYNGFVAYATTNESTNAYFGQNGGLQNTLPSLITMYYLPYVSLQDYFISSSNCVCNKARVALLEHRYFVPDIRSQNLEFTPQSAYISYGFMQLYKKEFNVNDVPHKTYTYRYLYPLFVNALSSGLFQNQYPTIEQYNQTKSQILTYIGGTVAEITDNDHSSNSCPKNFNGTFTFTVDNTYYADAEPFNGLYLANVCNFVPELDSQYANELSNYYLNNLIFLKVKNAIRNRFIGTVTFKGDYQSEVDEKLMKLGIVDANISINVKPDEFLNKTPIQNGNGG